MLENINNIACFEISKISFCEEIICMALKNLKLKNNAYCNLIKMYILNYEKTDIKIREKLKNIIIYIQKQANEHGINKTLHNLNETLDNLEVKKDKNLYLRLYQACIVYGENDIIKNQ